MADWAAVTTNPIFQASLLRCEETRTALLQQHSIPCCSRRLRGLTDRHYNLAGSLAIRLDALTLNTRSLC